MDVTGFDADVLHNFKVSAARDANQIPAMKYRSKIERTIEEAYASVVDRDPEQQGKLKSFIDSHARRARGSMAPDLSSRFINAVNQAAFLYYLTAPATAVANTLTIPMRVIGSLTSKYGYPKTIAKWVRYSAVWNTVGITEVLPDGTRRFTSPSLGSAANVRKNPLKKRAFEAGRNRGAYVTQVTAILRSGRTPKNAAERGFDVVKTLPVQIMSALFSATELVTRQTTYMMAFELEYEKNGGNFDAAVDKAVEITNDTGGNYGEYERPEFFKSTPVLGDATRSASLFKMFSVTQTRFYFKNARAMFGPSSSVVDRIDALNELTWNAGCRFIV